MKILKQNRKKKKEPKSGKGWCSGCDAALISNGERCPVCGYQPDKIRNKKPAIPFSDEFKTNK